jgi:chromosome segregation ATPase
MITLEQAEQSLDHALGRFERALNRKLASAAGGERAAGPPNELARERDALARDVAALGAECERLRAALDEARRENQSLREASTTVAQRLDGSIAEIDRMLEG